VGLVEWVDDEATAADDPLVDKLERDLHKVRKELAGVPCNAWKNTAAGCASCGSK
jgi:hypothetical protein